MFSKIQLNFRRYSFEEKEKIREIKEKRSKLSILEFYRTENFN